MIWWATSKPVFVVTCPLTLQRCFPTFREIAQSTDPGVDHGLTRGRLRATRPMRVFMKHGHSQIDGTDDGNPGF